MPTPAFTWGKLFVGMTRWRRRMVEVNTGGITVMVRTAPGDNAGVVCQSLRALV